jgi:hypothetical protein
MDRIAATELEFGILKGKEQSDLKELFLGAIKFRMVAKRVKVAQLEV